MGWSEEERNLRNGADGIVRRAHLSEHFVEPLQRSMQMDFHPTRGRCDILTMILCSPTLHKRHPNGAHFRQFKDRLESVIDRLR